MRVFCFFVYSTTIYCRVTTLCWTLSLVMEIPTKVTSRQKPHTVSHSLCEEAGASTVMIIPCDKCCLRGPGWEGFPRENRVFNDTAVVR